MRPEQDVRPPSPLEGEGLGVTKTGAVQSLPGYPDTLRLKSRAPTRAIGRRPRVELEPTDHPLAVEQRQGITLVREFAELALHGPAEV